MGGLGSKLVELGERAVGALADIPVRKATGSVLGSIFESGEHALVRQGSFSGMLAALLRTVESGSRREIATTIEPLAARAERIASSPEAHKAWHVVRTTGKLTGNAEIDRAALEQRSVVDSIYHKHAMAGFPVAKRVEGVYFSEMYPKEVFDSKSDLHKQAVTLLLSKGRAKDAASAERILSDFDPSMYEIPRYGKKVTGVFHPIETRRRLDLPEIARKDIAVDFDYIAGGIKSFHEKKVFGPDGEQLKGLLKLIRQNEGEVNYRYAASVASNFLGHDAGSTPGELEKAVRSYQIATKLGKAVLSHPLKTIDSILVTGQLKPFLETIATRFTDPEEWHAVGVRAAAGLNETIHQVRRIAQAENESLGSKVLRYQGFLKVINFQEYLNANMAKHVVLDDVEKLMSNPKDADALMRLRTLGLFPEDILKRGGASQEEFAIAGHKMNTIVLGGQRTALDLPPAWKGHWSVRTLTMFKPFLFNQAKLIKDYVILPALRDGNLKPLMYMSILYPTLGELATDLKVLARGRDPRTDRPDWEKFPLDRIISNISNVGGFGVAADVMSALTSASPTTTWQAIFGPAYSELVDIVRFPGLSPENKARAVVRRVPGVGLALSRYLMPTKHPVPDALQKGIFTKAAKKVVKVFTP